MRGAADRQRRRHDDAPLSRRRHPRLRLDDEPATSSTCARTFEHPTLPRDGDAAAAAAGARRAGGTPLRRHGGHAASTTASGSAPIRTATSPSSIPRTRAAAAAWSTRRSSPPAARWLAPRGVTQPESVTIHEAGHQLWYGIVGSNEFEHAWMDEGLNTFSTARAIEAGVQPNYLALRYFGGFIPWVFRDIRLPRDRRQSAARLPRQRGSRRAVDADVPLLARHGDLHHLQQDGAVAAHAGAAPRLADCCSGSCRPTSSAGSSAIRSRTISSPSSTRSAAGT